VTRAAAAVVRVRVADERDASRIAAFGAQGFHDTFAADNRAEDMAAYLGKTFGEELQRAELRDPRSTYLVAERDADAGTAEMVGYCRVMESEPPSCVATRPAAEIARLYARRDMIGQGVGASLMRAALAHAATLGARVVWLGVWEHNTRAIAFYERWGFTDVGSLAFVLGADVQTDRVMEKEI
jgi:diamine N-acetyltransferase